MDDVTSIIRDAWNRIAPTLRDDPHLLAQRIARRRRPTLMRPPRAWCIAVRASDHRIDAPRDHPHDHDVTLTRSLLARLCAPVRLTAPGEPPRDTARKLGTTPPGLMHARVKKIFRAHYIPPTAGRGRPVPLLYTDQSLDPCAQEFARHDRAWTWTTMELDERLPPDFAQTCTRVPYFRAHVPRHYYDENAHPERDTRPPRESRKLPPPPPDHVWYKWSRSGHYLGNDPTNWRKSFQDLGERPPRDKPRRGKAKRGSTELAEVRPAPSRSAGSLHFAGFRWLCPSCGKTCRTLYCPAPPIHLLARVQPRIAQCVDIPRQLTGFACARCHRVRFMSRAAPDTWNQIVAYLTAGLLYGKEVPKPKWFVTERKRAYHPKPNSRPPLRRQQILRRLLNGWTLQQIADDLHIKPLSVHNEMKTICRQEAVPDRAELARKLGSPHPQPLTRNQLARRRRGIMLQLILDGRSNHEIKTELGIDEPTMNAESNKIYRAHGVQGRRGLEAKLGVTITPFKSRRTEIRARRAAGQTYKQIAADLGISFWTVHNHVKALKRQAHPLPPAGCEFGIIKPEASDDCESDLSGRRV